MLDLLSTLWPLVLLLSIPHLTNLIVLTIYRRVQAKHDWAIADDLPQTAGQWVRERAAALGIAVIVTDKKAPFHSNAFHPRHQTIQLTDEVHFKPDPVFWAIAAHELGHAHLEVWHPRYGRVKQIARWLSHVLVMLGLALGLGNILYGLPGVTELAFGLLLGALLCDGVHVFDEALASLVAYRELGRSAHLTHRHLLAIRHVLFVAFSSYFVMWLSYAVLLSQWHRLELLGTGRLIATSTLTTLGWIAAFTLTGFGVLVGVTRIVTAVRAPAIADKPPRVSLSLIGLLWGPALFVLIWLVWDLSASTTWAWVVMLALMPVARLSGLVAVPLALPLAWFQRLCIRFEGPGIERTIRFLRERQDGSPLILEGNGVANSIKLRNEATTTIGGRLFELVKLAYVPLLVALWWL